MKPVIICVLAVATLAGVLLWLRSRAESPPASNGSARPPVDLNKPVENPSLVAALDTHVAGSTVLSDQRLCRELKAAVYLAPMLTDQMKVTRSESYPGKATVQKGSLLKLLIAQDDEGRSILPLFTDWQQIRLWTKENVDILVLPAKDAWDFSTMKDTYVGVVINPAGHALALTRKDMETLQRNTEQMVGTDAEGRDAAQP